MGVADPDGQAPELLVRRGHPGLAQDVGAPERDDRGVTGMALGAEVVDHRRLGARDRLDHDPRHGGERGDDGGAVRQHQGRTRLELALGGGRREQDETGDQAHQVVSQSPAGQHHEQLPREHGQGDPAQVAHAVRRGAAQFTSSPTATNGAALPTRAASTPASRRGVV